MIYHLRENYDREKLEVEGLQQSPFKQFDLWFKDAQAAGVKEPNAMTLATCSPEGMPSARVVLLKDYGEVGFSFFTNYESRKGAELALNPNAALVFLWLDLHRQVRIEGKVEKLSAAQSEAYFHSRPRGSQIGAWASPQSAVLSDKAVLESRVEALEQQYLGQEKLPLPPFWGGYLLRPSMIEFWQGRPNRLHDRFRYTPAQEGAWNVERLAP
jgi:pyridoxamine 5'-phosphate oxidase